jgi:hypothetical protein
MLSERSARLRAADDRLLIRCARQRRNRMWTVEGANGIGRPLVHRSGSATVPGWVNTIMGFDSAPLVIATYSHCRSSVPVTSALPTWTERPRAEWPVTA